MKKLVSSLSLIFILISGCEENPGYSGEKLEFYLLKSFNAVNGSSEIKSQSVVLEDFPLIYYEEIIGYDPSTCTFRISGAKITEIKNMMIPSAGIAFAVTIDKQIIYTGYFYTVISSIPCDWVVIMTNSVSSLSSEIKVELGYPVENEKLKSIDPRNDKRILKLLSTENKLIQ
jgi:hypothetical protein